MGTLTRIRRFVEPADGPDRPPYECQQCGERFEEAWQVCPDCGGFSVERREWWPEG